MSDAAVAPSLFGCGTRNNNNNNNIFFFYLTTSEKRSERTGSVSSFSFGSTRMRGKEKEKDKREERDYFFMLAEREIKEIGQWR